MKTVQVLIIVPLYLTLVASGIGSAATTSGRYDFEKGDHEMIEDEVSNAAVTETTTSTTTTTTAYDFQEEEFTIGPKTRPDMDDIDVMNMFEELTKSMKKYGHVRSAGTKRLKTNETRPAKRRKPMPPMYEKGKLNEAYLRRMSRRLYKKMVEYIVGKGNWRTLRTSFQEGQRNRAKLFKKLERKMLSTKEEDRTPYPKTILMNIDQAMNLVHFAAKVELLKLLKNYQISKKCFWKGEGCPRTKKLEKALHRDLREAVDVFQTQYVPQAFSWIIKDDLHVPTFSYITITNFKSEATIGGRPENYGGMIEGKFEPTKTGLYHFNFQCLVEINATKEPVESDESVSVFICPNGCCTDRPYEIDYPISHEPKDAKESNSDNKTLDSSVPLQPNDHRLALSVTGALYLKDYDYAAVYIRNKSKFNMYVLANTTTFLGYFVGK